MQQLNTIDSDAAQSSSTKSKLKSPMIAFSVLLEELQLVFTFQHLTDEHWFQEDITSLYPIMFHGLASIDIKEMISGADRENIRFTWQQHYDFILNFDCYSQSCWLEAENALSQQQLTLLYQAVKNAADSNQPMTMNNQQVNNEQTNG